MRIRIKRYPGSQEQVLKKERLKCRSENNTYTLYKLITVRNSIRATNTSVNAATLRKIRSIVFLGIIPILSNVAIQERRKGRWIEKTGEELIQASLLTKIFGNLIEGSENNT
jgi:hypothetical protein